MSAKESVLSVEDVELPEDFDESQFEDPDDFVDEISDEGESNSLTIRILQNFRVRVPSCAVAKLVLICECFDGFRRTSKGIGCSACASACKAADNWSEGCQ